MTLYQYCIVNAITIRLTYQNTGTIPATMFMTCYSSSQAGDAASPPLINTIKESVNTQWWDTGVGTSVYNPHTITCRYDLSSIEGASLTPVRTWSSTYNGSPTLVQSVQLGAIASDVFSTIAGRLSVQASYHCRFYARKVFGTA